MYEFESLSLSTQDNLLGEDDVLAMSNLTITDKKAVTNELITKYIQHSPISPSPLKAIVSFSETECSDEMDVDATSEDLLQAQSRSLNTPSSEKYVEEVENSEDDEVINEEGTEKNEQTAMIKALLSPTSLGIALATKDLDKETPVDETNLISKSTEAQPPFVNLSSAPQSTPDESESDGSVRMRYQTPWQLQVHNHHYYMMPGQNFQDTWQPASDISKLPVPWSADSKPVSKTSYALTTYLQMALNTITILVVCSTITAFVRTVRTDIRSTWEHTKLELDFESSNCKVKYLANHCAGDGAVPALIEKCSEWEKCMNRNNDIYFRARTSMGARLVGEIVNSLIEPLGWKALLSIIITLAIWSFSSNFLLGFMRARSYYGQIDTKQNESVSLASLSPKESVPTLLQTMEEGNHQT